MESEKIQFAYTQRNQQKFVYKVLHLETHESQRQMLDMRICKQNCFNVARCYYCGMRGCPGKLYTNLDAADTLAAEDPRPVSEIYDELASNATTILDTAAYFPSWDQARNSMYYSRLKKYPRLPARRQDLRLMYYSRLKKYPRLPARRQDLRLTAEQTTTKSGAQFLMHHLPTSNILIFAPKTGVRLLA
ncbi:hypothetical protein T4C_11836 [Trichinella pseudospiralis]|uniref:Uncharacterized protein n=1 Tax=Trichinella pseudospiralis TaxID=6337 RepID=A0A0V1J6F7_TRIPS|nr:hypothetical protein T4C_11836 [Trichinella pseudospiralis]